MSEPIALTETWKNRLDEINTFLANQSSFNYDSVDLTQDYSKESGDFQSGFDRLLNDNNYVDKQITRLERKLNANPGKQCRFVLTLPSEAYNFNGLRDIFLQIQRMAGMTRDYVFCSPIETDVSVISYLNNLEGDYVVVIPMSMEGRVLDNIVSYLQNANKEFVFLYEDWHGFEDNFRYVIELAEQMPDTIHMSCVEVDMNNYGNKDVISTVLMSKGFKSVSLKDTKFKGYFNRWVGRKQKTAAQRIAESLWLDQSGVSYNGIHNSGCSCNLTNTDIQNIAVQHGVKYAATWHGLSILYDLYVRLKSNVNERESLLETQQARLILTALNLA